MPRSNKRGTLSASLAEALSKLAAQGQSIFELADFAKALGADRTRARKLLYQLRQSGWVAQLTRGKYLIVPLEAGPEGTWSEDALVIAYHLAEPASVAYWSACHYWGWTEQVPRTVFVQTTSRKKEQTLEIFGINYRIVRVAQTKFFGFRKEWIEETQITITDREKTIIDCLDKPQYSGGIIEVAKSLKNGKFDKDKLVAYAEKIKNSAVLRRLGFLCEFLRIEINLPRIETRNYLYLDPTMPKNGIKDAKWHLIVNLDEKILGALE